MLNDTPTFHPAHSASSAPLTCVRPSPSVLWQIGQREVFVRRESFEEGDLLHDLPAEERTPYLRGVAEEEGYQRCTARRAEHKWQAQEADEEASRPRSHCSGAGRGRCCPSSIRSSGRDEQACSDHGSGAAAVRRTSPHLAPPRPTSPHLANTSPHPWLKTDSTAGREGGREAVSCLRLTVRAHLVLCKFFAFQSLKARRLCLWPRSWR